MLLGNLKKSTENLASRPGSVRAKSPSGVPDIPEEPPASRQDLFAVPSQTIFMQTVEFLLEVKAMPVSQNISFFPDTIGHFSKSSLNILLCQHFSLFCSVHRKSTSTSLTG